MGQVISGVLGDRVERRGQTSQTADTKFVGIRIIKDGRRNNKTPVRESSSFLCLECGKQFYCSMVVNIKKKPVKKRNDTMK